MSGTLRVDWSKQPCITRVTSPWATRSSWRSSKWAQWMKPLRLTHSHLFFLSFLELCHWHVYLFLVQGSVAEVRGVIAALVMVLTMRWWTQRSVSSGYDDHTGGSAKSTDFFPGWVQRARSKHVTGEPSIPAALVRAHVHAHKIQMSWRALQWFSNENVFLFLLPGNEHSNLYVAMR